MSRFELYSPEGLRSDGRRFNELRLFECSINTHPKTADGSSLVEMGSSKVLCMVKGPREPESRARGRQVICVTVDVAPFSTTDRRKQSVQDRRLKEIATTLERTFGEVVLTNLCPRTEIDITLLVLEQDGGLLPCCINAATLALINAGVSMTDYVSSCGVAMCDDCPLLDPNRIEENEFPFVAVGIVGTSPKIQTLVLERRVGSRTLQPALELAIAGCHEIRSMMDEEVRLHGNLENMETRLFQNKNVSLKI